MDEKEKIDPTVKAVLMLLGVGTVLAAAMIAPGSLRLLKLYNQLRCKKDKREWEKFNLSRLRYLIKRLQKQKVVEIKGDIVRITNKGKQKLLHYRLEDISLSGKTDGKWRLIIYDISNLKKPRRELFRKILKRLNFLPLQESVYLTPDICEDEIAYLRELFDLKDEVVVLKVSEIENDTAYRKYFGI